MSARLGTLSIVLHGHLPFVLNHGTWPHGEAWLFEAAAEVYLPLLDTLDALPAGRAVLTVGLTPVLLEQLAHPRFKAAFVDYLNERVERATRDAGESPALGTRWADGYRERLAHFERIDREIVGEFARHRREGRVQILTSNATHGYMPLILNDQMLAAQMRAGVATSKRFLGDSPTGMWLPECAYRPEWAEWLPAVLYGDARRRVGLEHFIAFAGVTHFFVESTTLAHAAVMGTQKGGAFQTANDTAALRQRDTGWKEPFEPVGVASDHRPADVFAFARHPQVSERVWSGKIGYPSDGAYLEFHRKRGPDGLRYHRVTSVATPLGEKLPYEPRVAEQKARAHALHFVETVRDALLDYRGRTGRAGNVVASFDAELFGHWWHEGPTFLREVIRLLADDAEVALATPEQTIAERPPEKVMRLPESSWGEGGDHRVWLNPQTKWYWEIEYRAEGRFLKLLHELPWREDDEARLLLERAGRELLLLQASDWLFVIHSGGAVDYGIERIALQAVRFDRLCAMAERVATRQALTELMRVQLAEIDAHDTVFETIDLNWWS